MDDLAAAELGEQRLGGEEAFEDLPAGAVLEHALLPLRPLFAPVQRGIGNYELARHATRLREEPHALLVLEVSVEVAREGALEGAALEGKVERVSANEGCARAALARYA